MPSLQLIGLLSLVTALAILVLTLINKINNRKKQELDTIQILLDKYEVVRLSVRELWDYYRLHGENSDAVKQVFDSTDKVMVDHLSVVIEFYTLLGSYYDNCVISKKKILQHWNKKDISILEKIVLPMHECHCSQLGQHNLDLPLIKKLL